MWWVNNLKIDASLQKSHRGIPDGFCIDQQNVIYCSCETGLVILLMDGTLLGRVLLDKTTSNCTFGADQKTLFITATNSLYRLTCY